MKTILIVAGGPSVNTLDMALARRFVTIAINNSWKKAPWAVECFAGDSRWWRDPEDNEGWGEGRKLVEGFKGMISTTDAIRGVIDRPNVKKFFLTAQESQIDNPGAVLAPDSGTKAMCRAYHRGAKTILLAGYDGQRGPSGESHHHNEHKAATPLRQWAQFSSVHRRMKELLAARGVDVYRVTEPGIPEIPYRPLEEFLCRSQESLALKRSIVSSTTKTYCPTSLPATQNTI